MVSIRYCHRVENLMKVSTFGYSATFDTFKAKMIQTISDYDTLSNCNLSNVLVFNAGQIVSCHSRIEGSAHGK